MAQKTNLNVSPYFDDFDSNKNFYKVLFNPGRPIQARELNTIQSILQNQVESFGKHLFKEGSVVIPGNITYDPLYYSVRLNPTTFGIDISLYIDKYIGKKITGQISGITALIQKVEIPNNTNQLDYITIFVKYLNSDTNFSINQFQDGESLSCVEDIVYGNTTIVAGTPFSSLISTDATAVGSAVSIENGIYFVRGTFSKISADTIILDYYSNTPSYRVGLKISEEIITAKEDETLYDNAKGFTNYAAPGADRLKISLSLSKKSIDSVSTDTDFIELLRVENGNVRKLKVKTDYSLIKDYLAERTFDESGNYSVEPFKISLHNSLNDRLGNDGLFFDNEKTADGNTPSDDLMCIKLSPGKAYVKGYDIYKPVTTILDVEKPRETENISAANVPFQMGNLIRVNNVSGSPKINYLVELQQQRKGGTLNKIGDARVYNFGLTDASYSSAVTVWDLYLFDVQTYTTLTLNRQLNSTELPASSYVVGKSSGASGYAVSAGAGSVINLNQTSGKFIQGEQIVINGIEIYPRTITKVDVYDLSDVKQIRQTTTVSGFAVNFTCDTLLEKLIPSGFNATDTISVDGSNVVKSPGRLFTAFKPGNIIIYQKPNSTVETYNRVVSVDPTGASITVASVTDVSGVCDGTVGVTTSATFALGTPTIRNNDNAYLYARLPNNNIAAVGLNSSSLIFTEQSINPGTTNPSTGNITITLANFSFPDGVSNPLFMPFDAERYSVIYSDGSIEKLTSDKFTLEPTNQISLKNLATNKLINVFNATFAKNTIQSKIKQFNRSKVINVQYSKYPQSGTQANSSINDGLTYNQYYGLRVQDDKICLKYPDVYNLLAVYQSLDSSSPVLDTLNFSILANIQNNVIIGENVIGSTSKCIARVVTKSTNSVTVVYLNKERFFVNEEVKFEESNITTEVNSITIGKYVDITNNFTLDKGQKEQYYDYSSIIRNSGTAEPNRRLLIVFDYYTVPADDNGDVFTVLSYDEERFLKDIPILGVNNTRASDTLDFRPRVSEFTGSSSSPFDFSSRNFESSIKFNLTPEESSIISYDYYLGRVDKIYLDKSEEFVYVKGVSSGVPITPVRPDDVMELATIVLPPYLYTPKDANIQLVDNRRYTMRDIGLIESRVSNLERLTSLSLLELNTQTFQVQDAEGFNRFKTGFFVDDFKDDLRINNNISSVEVDTLNQELTPIISRNSLKNYLAPKTQISNEEVDLSTNYDLIDPNLKKTGDVVTLKYESVPWISQLVATGISNVNPYNVFTFNGLIGLNPSNDTWVRTVRLPDRTINITDYVTLQVNQEVYLGDTRTRKRARGSLVGQTITTRVDVGTTVSSTQSSNTTTRKQEYYVGSQIEQFMRSRNVEFKAINLKPYTQFYQFLDGNSSVEYVPKLVEIATDSTLQTYGASAAFKVGETVVGTVRDMGRDVELIKFRVAYPNHKLGKFKEPSLKFTSNPYIREETIPEAYSNSSKVLNVDTYSLAEEAQGKYSGFIVRGMKLVGEESGAIAYVKDRRLLTDEFGDLFGTFYLLNPNTTPPPTVRINTGSKTYRLTSSPTNATPLPGDTDLSFAEARYRANGTLELYESLITNTTTVTTINTKTTSYRTVTVDYYHDPLAQSFQVGGSAGVNDDNNGVFVTGVDLFFKKKDIGNAPLTVQIRTMQLGTPTRTFLGRPAVLQPNQINISDNASAVTHVDFPYPIYLEPNNEYCIVLLAPESNQYEVFIAEMGAITVETQNLPDASNVRYSQQFAMGTLFKSQNGSVWTGNQDQDMKFKLYRADFTTTPGVAYFYNPTLDKSNGYVSNLLVNPLTVLPKKIKLGITTTTDANTITILSNGRKVGESSRDYVYGTIVGTGCSVSSVGLTTAGENYRNSSNNVSTFNITGNGSGLTLNITASSGKITGTPTIVNPGSGYAIGDIVGIVTSTAGGSGTGALITITGNNNGIDTLYLSNVQAQNFTEDGTASLVYYSDAGTRVSMASTFITSSDPYGEFSTGDYIKVDHFNHGMYGLNNKLILSGVAPNNAPSSLSQNLTSSSTVISVASTVGYDVFEGIGIGATNPGFVLIDNEIIQYEKVDVGALSAITRGINGTQVLDHITGSVVFKYELYGVSLRRINTIHDIDDSGLGVDGYYIKIDRLSNGMDRSLDRDGTILSPVIPKLSPELSFTGELSCGGSEVFATENIMFDSIVPYYEMISPGAFTSVSGKIRTVSGTSISGKEESFIDQGYEPVQLNTINKLSSTRLICSRINEDTYLTSMSRNKSFTTALTLTSTNRYLSPLIFINNTFTDFRSNRINSPIINYASDGRVNSINDDPHMAIYVSNTVNLAQPATSLKVIISAYRHQSADFRVLYNLIRPDSSEVEQSFELFPGYNNLTIDSNNDGFLDIVDPSKNNGLPDVFVPPSLENQFLDYEFSAGNLGQFIGYTIKIVMSSTNQAYPPRFKDLRSIALR